MRHVWLVVNLVFLLAVGGVAAPGAPSPPSTSMERRLLFGPETAPEWSAAEATLTEARGADLPRAPAGIEAALHWHVTVDYSAGEPNYPIGWPRVNHALPEGPARDWSAWDYLGMWVYADTSRAALPEEPAALLLYTPDRTAEYDRPLAELKKGEWVEITLPLAQVPHDHDVRLLQFYLAEANYRDRDRLDLYIADLSLLRYARPTLLEFAPESAVMFADASRIPVQFRLTGIAPGESAAVSCELRRGGQVAARASLRSERGPRQAVLELGRQRLEPGDYELTAHVAGGPEARTKVRLVASPWR
jgi:hypothetical protein